MPDSPSSSANQGGMSTAQPEMSDRIWTLPNLISISRLLLLLPLTVWFLVQQNYVGALWSLVALGITDWLDGFLARRLNLVTRFGKNLDPLADRLSVLAVVWALIVDGILPWPYIVVIAGIDVTVGLLGLAWFGGPPDIPVSRVGKARTAGILVSLPLLILEAATGIEWIGVVGLVILTFSVIGHVWAGLGYLRIMHALHRTRLAEVASAKETQQ